MHVSLYRLICLGFTYHGLKDSFALDAADMLSRLWVQNGTHLLLWLVQPAVRAVKSLPVWFMA